MTVLRRRRDSDSEPEPEGYVPPPPQASLGDALAQALNQVREGLNSVYDLSHSITNCQIRSYKGLWKY